MTRLQVYTGDSQGQPYSRAHCSTSRCPPFAATEHHSPFPVPYKLAASVAQQSRYQKSLWKRVSIQNTLQGAIFADRNGNEHMIRTHYARSNVVQAKYNIKDCFRYVHVNSRKHRETVTKLAFCKSR